MLNAVFPLCGTAGRADDFELLQHHMHRSWTTADGLPGMVFVIAQTPEGYLWLGTQHGLIRFDGVRLTTLAGGDVRDLENQWITALLVDHAGDLWAGTNGGVLAHLSNSRIVRTYSNRDGLSSGAHQCPIPG